jgi:hypothetical protein
MGMMSGIETGRPACRNAVRYCGSGSAAGVLIVLSLTLLHTPARSLGQLREPPPPEISPDLRLAQLAQANIIATHAYQVLLARKTGKGDPACYSPGSLSDRQLEEIVGHQAKLLASDRNAIKSWTRAHPTKFDPRRNLDPILSAPLVIPENAPVNVILNNLRNRTRTSLARIRSIASLYQTVLEIERDGDLLQQEYGFYIALGLPVYVGQLDLPGTDEEFLVAGKELERATCASPFDTSAAAWQIAGRKVWNWGEKNLHVRDERVVANEIMQEPDVAALLPAIRSMPPQKVAVIGHSFTMGAHWSSPSSFANIAASIVARENQNVVFRYFQAGGLTASRAQRNFYSDVLAWKPDKVLLVVLTRNEEDYRALEQMGGGFRQAGIRCFVFDNIHDPEALNPVAVALFNKTARDAGIGVIEVERVLSSTPERDQFVCLDGIHMKEPYHRLMAKEWLKFLAGGTSHFR